MTPFCEAAILFGAAWIWMWSIGPEIKRRTIEKNEARE